MTKGNTSFLTNEEIIAQLTLRDDLSDLEQDLLDRLILANDEVNRLAPQVTEADGGSKSGETPNLM